MDSKNVIIVAGEASGDLHGASLVREIKKIDPKVTFSGIGGRGLKSAGMDVRFDSKDLAVMGIFEVIVRLAKIFQAFRYLRHFLKTHKPDLLILIDYPDFNLPLAKIAKKCDIPVMYYISPQVWAWRKGRVKKIAKFVDKMVVIFPFEVTFYKKYNVDVEFVGHPLLDIVQPTSLREEAKRQLGLKEGKTTIALFPGSRSSEIRRILPSMLGAAKILKEALPDIQFILSIAPTLGKHDIEPLIPGDVKDLKVTDGYIYDVMNTSDLIITASGTATVEAAIMNIPMVIIYKVSPLSYFIGRRLIKVNHIGMVNLIAGERVVPELIQDEATPDRITNECLRILGDKLVAVTIKEKLKQVKDRLGVGGASRKAALIAYGLLRHEA